MKSFLGGARGKEPTYQCRRHETQVPGSGRSPGGGHGNPFQDSCLENSMDKKTRQDSPWGHKESDMTEQLALSFSVFR